MSYTKYWLFTLFGDLPDNEIALVLPEGAAYLVYQRETAPTTGKLHYQCYIEFEKLKRLTALKKIYPTAHWDNRKGTKEEAIHYVTKPHDGCDCQHCVAARAGPDAPIGRSSGPWTLGEPSNERTGPKKPDIKDVLRLRAEGCSRSHMIREYPALYQRYRNTIADWDAAQRPPEKTRRVIFCYGPPRMGKTYWARHNWPSFYMVPPPKAGAVWFTGYENEPVVIFDEYSGQLTLDEWKNYTDVYPLQAHTKGGFAWYNPDVVVITSNSLPGDWYVRTTKRKDDSEKDRSVDLSAMEDRIHEWHYWATTPTPPPIPKYRTQPFPGWVHHYPSNPEWVAPPPRPPSPDMTNDPLPFPPRPATNVDGVGPLMHRTYTMNEYMEEQRLRFVNDDKSHKRKREANEEDD